MFLIRIEKKMWYISTRDVEICSAFTLITMVFHKFSLCNAKYMELSLSERVNIHTHKNKVMLFLKIEKKYWYIRTCHVEKSKGLY
jgi:hypothetical protein